MTDPRQYEVQVVLRCPLCGGQLFDLEKKGKPCRFRCTPCHVTWKPEDIGDFKRALVHHAANDGTLDNVISVIESPEFIAMEARRAERRKQSAEAVAGNGE